MCSHYDPVLKPERLREFFGVDDLPTGLKPSLWPTYLGPFIRTHEFAAVGDDAVPARELLVGSFGLIPIWAKDIKAARTLFNSRSETAAIKNSFKHAWKHSQHCIIPADAIFEPDWRSGKAQATRIVRTDGKPMGIAGLWEKWQNPADGSVAHSFTMLTINADHHEFMRDYHKPGDEKRMIPAC